MSRFIEMGDHVDHGLSWEMPEFVVGVKPCYVAKINGTNWVLYRLGGGAENNTTRAKEKIEDLNSRFDNDPKKRQELARIVADWSRWKLSIPEQGKVVRLDYLEDGSEYQGMHGGAKYHKCT